MRALGRVLVADIEADLDLPPFDRAVMDGYALRSLDVQTAPRRLRVIGDIAAGDAAGMMVRANEAVRIMTGAPVPEGADAVQMIEETVAVAGGGVEVLKPVKAGENIAPRASEVRKGQVVLKAGQKVNSARIGVLAAFGRRDVEVFGSPRAVIIPTGTELVDISETPGPGQIRDSNALMLKAQCTTLGIEADVARPLGDDREVTSSVLERFRDVDLLIFSGGVSMGERDYVHTVVKESDAEVIFHKAAIKPGKPILCARRAGQIIFGLPGNPVSSYVTFELFVRPAARAMGGSKKGSLPRLKARLETAVTHHPGRLFFKPARLRCEGGGFAVMPLETRGSADLTAFSAANALVLVPAESRRLEAGRTVDVITLESFWKEGFEDEAYTS